MPVIISLGTNLDNRELNLELARSALGKEFLIEAKSRIFQSKAVDYLDQPSFLNQLLQMNTPGQSPLELLASLKNLEIKLGRKKSFAKGPRSIDIDIIFYDLLLFQNDQLTIPHPSAIYRSFIIEPLRELPFFNQLAKTFYIPTTFPNSCLPLD